VQRHGLDAPVRRRLLAAAGILFALAFYPALFPGALNLGVTLVLHATLATAWDVLGGWAGQLSLGHAALVGLGAYTLGLLTQVAGWQSVGGLGLGSHSGCGAPTSPSPPSRWRRSCVWWPSTPAA